MKENYNKYIFENIEEFKKRFEQKVIKYDEGCWDWKGGKSRTYPIICYVYSIGAHRVSWTIVNGEIPQELHVLHLCDNSMCTRPDHLKIGTHKENMQYKSKFNKLGIYKKRDTNNTQRLTIQVSEDFHYMIKRKCLEKRISIKDFVLIAIADYMAYEDDLNGKKDE